MGQVRSATRQHDRARRASAKANGEGPYQAPAVLDVRVAPNITLSMQNTGGTEPDSTFRVAKRIQASQTPTLSLATALPRVQPGGECCGSQPLKKPRYPRAAAGL